MATIKRQDIEAETAFISTISPPELKPMNIYERMLKVQEELGIVAKNITIQATKTSGYKAVSERDVVDAVKPLLAKYRVLAYPYSRTILENETLESEKVYGDSKTKVFSKFIRIETIYRFVNVDKPEEVVDVPSYGDGIDTGDKCVGKAMTYSDKYALLRALLVSTGDDPDQEKSPDEGYAVTKTEEQKATEKQIEYLFKLYGEEQIANWMQRHGITSYDQISMKTASELIGRAKERNKRDGN